jgi:hypothetical protein
MPRVRRMPCDPLRQGRPSRHPMCHMPPGIGFAHAFKMNLVDDDDCD